jgi:hypothetical protein
MFNIGSGLGNSEASIGGSSAGIGPVNARARWFNPHPFDKYAFG